MRRFMLLLLLSLSWVAPANVARACPLCRDAVPESGSVEEEDPVRLGLAYNRSILLMLAVPYTMVTLVGALVYRQIRLRAALEEQQTRAPLPPGTPLHADLPGDRACSLPSTGDGS